MMAIPRVWKIALVVVLLLAVLPVAAVWAAHQLAPVVWWARGAVSLEVAAVNAPVPHRVRP
jgi:hypothetical protein